MMRSRLPLRANLPTDPALQDLVRYAMFAPNSHNTQAFVQELKDWIRFNDDAALATPDGLFTDCSGNPTLPSWLGKLMFNQFFSKDSENQKYTKHMNTSAGVVIFVADQNNKEDWINAGRNFQRFALQAPANAIRTLLK